MSLALWLRIIAKVLELIADGLPKDEAVARAAKIFNVTQNDIWRHMK